MASENFHIGLSDIDLIIFLNADADQRIKDKVTNLYINLAHFIPPLGKSTDEIGIYTVDEFCQVMEEIPFYRYRFTVEKESWKLLFGKDLRDELTSLHGQDISALAIEELKVWWRYLANDLFIECNTLNYKRNYLYYKAFSETGKVYLRVRYNIEVKDRNIALSILQEKWEPARSRLIDTLKDFKIRFSFEEIIDSQGLLNLYILLLKEIFRYDSRESLKKKDKMVVSLTLTDCQAFPVHYTSDEQIHLIPRLDFDPDILTASDIGNYFLVVKSLDLPVLERLKRIIAHFKSDSFLKQITLEPVWANEIIALSLHPAEPWGAIKTSHTDPIFFEMIKSGAFAINSCRQIKTLTFEASLEQISELLKVRKEKLCKMINDDNILKLEPAASIKFFWSSLRMFLMCLSLENGCLTIPLDHPQILKDTIKYIDDELEWINKFPFNVKILTPKDLDMVFRYSQSALMFLRKIAKLLTIQDKQKENLNDNASYKS